MSPGEEEKGMAGMWQDGEDAHTGRGSCLAGTLTAGDW